MSCARKILGQPLARWGFTALAVLAFTQAMVIPLLVCWALAYTGWEAKS